MMQRMQPGYGSLPFGPPLPSSAPRTFLRRVKRQVIIGLALLCGGLLLGLATSLRGLLAVALAWVVLAQLGHHRADGRGLRAGLEYAVVAAMVVALVGALLPTGPAPKAKAPARRGAAEAAQPDPVGQARAKIAGWLETAKDALPEIQVTPPKEGR